MELFKTLPIFLIQEFSICLTLSLVIGLSKLLPIHWRVSLFQFIQILFWITNFSFSERFSSTLSKDFVTSVLLIDDNNNDQTCQGYYWVYANSYNLDRAAFKLWVHFEKETNYKQKAKKWWKDWDGWNIDNMYEVYAGAGAASWALSDVVY